MDHLTELIQAYVEAAIRSATMPSHAAHIRQAEALRVLDETICDIQSALGKYDPD